MGDNIFLVRAAQKLVRLWRADATVTGYRVMDPERFGVVEFDDDFRAALSLGRKRKQPKINWAVTGLYFYDSKVVRYAKRVKPSGIGEAGDHFYQPDCLEEGKRPPLNCWAGAGWIRARQSRLRASTFVRAIGNARALKYLSQEVHGATAAG